MNGTGFWTIITVVSAAVGAVFMLVVSHASEPKHPAAAHEEDVNNLAVKLERVSTDLDNNKRVLGEVKVDISELRVEQRVSTESILRAIRSGDGG
ncbi:MAG: hypothetical protein GY772_20670 [bacterium]|jgi:hypothetical protein|nr:hypothetical protein [bacterium]HJO22045.1 hypothetical protein [Myxococcota bacterium]|tara:strand:+ start:88 stop:372 length:285 start_codon:yes stop_codon:yes gene_type:complete